MLGVSPHKTVLENILCLREHVVKEFATNQSLYDMCGEYTKEEYEVETNTFLKHGKYEGPLGDSMPLALSNVLKMQFLVFTNISGMPFLTVSPVNVLCDALPLVLVYDHTGGGHYDATDAESGCIDSNSTRQSLFQENSRKRSKTDVKLMQSQNYEGSSQSHLSVQYFSKENLTSSDLEMPMEPYFRIAVVQNLSDCCSQYNWKCKGDFTSIPNRFQMIEFNPLFEDFHDYSKKCCNSCTLPENSSSNFAFLYHVVCEKWIRQYLGETQYKWTEMAAGGNIKVFYRIALREQQRIVRIPTRRNIFNVAICYPTLNAIQSFHMTFRYKPRGVGLHGFAEKICNEIVGSMRIYLHENPFTGFFCTCN